MYKVLILNAQRDSGESNPNNKIPRHLITVRDSLGGEVLFQHYTKADPLVFDDSDGVNSFLPSEMLSSQLIDIEISNIALFKSSVFCRVEYISMDGLPNEDIENGNFGVVQVNSTKTIREGERFTLRNVPYRFRWNLIIETYNYDLDNTTTANVLGVRGYGQNIEGSATYLGETIPYGWTLKPEIELYKLSDSTGLIRLPNSRVWLDGEVRPQVYFVPMEQVIDPPPPPPPPPPPLPPGLPVDIMKEVIIPDEPIPFVVTSDFVRQLTPYYKRSPMWLALLRSIFIPIQRQANEWSIFEQQLYRDVYRNGTSWSLQYFLNRDFEFAQGTITVQNQENGGFFVLVPTQLTNNQRDIIAKYVDKYKLAGISYLIQNSV